METIEATATVPAPALVAGENEANNYAAVRYNAMKHGVLSKHVVLPHEDKNEFADMLTALAEEHLPMGPTEAHLVEELAGIMWRKRRVLQAEGAAINRGLRSVVTGAYSNPAKAAVPFGRGLSDKPTDMQNFMEATPEEVTQRQKEARYDLEGTEKAASILRKGGTTVYKKALKALLPDSRDWWKEFIEEEEYKPDTEGLTAFINEHLMPLCVSVKKEAMHHYAIKTQTLGEGLKANRLEKLSRYETHLDRKFERTLAMLIKLKELRGRK